jgi:signal transduction histidine kinase
MARDLQQALDDAGRLAHLIYPPLLEAGGLATALRAAAVATGVRARIEVAPDVECAPEVAGSIYFCWLDLLDATGAGAGASIAVRIEEGALVFVVDERDAAPIADEAVRRMRDRVEAFGGRLGVEADGAGGRRLTARLPVSP